MLKKLVLIASSSSYPSVAQLEEEVKILIAGLELLLLLFVLYSWLPPFLVFVTGDLQHIAASSLRALFSVGRG